MNRCSAGEHLPWELYQSVFEQLAGALSSDEREQEEYGSSTIARNPTPRDNSRLGSRSGGLRPALSKSDEAADPAGSGVAIP